MEEAILSHPYHKTVKCNNESCTNIIGLLSIPDSEFPDLADNNIVTLLYVRDKNNSYSNISAVDLANDSQCNKCDFNIYHCSKTCYKKMNNECYTCPKQVCSAEGCEEEEVEKCPDCYLYYCVSYHFTACNNCFEHICYNCSYGEGYCQICISENIFLGNPNHNQI